MAQPNSTDAAATNETPVADAQQTLERRIVDGDELGRFLTTMPRDTSPSIQLAYLQVAMSGRPMILQGTTGFSIVLEADEMTVEFFRRYFGTNQGSE